MGSSESDKKCGKWKSCSDALQEEPKKYLSIKKLWEVKKSGKSAESGKVVKTK